MAVRTVLLFLPLLWTSTTSSDNKTPRINALELPADTAPIEIKINNLYAPQIYNVYTGSFGSRCDSGENEWYTIQAPINGLVMDGRDPTQMRLQYLNGHPQQLWKFERAGAPGVYYIINNHTGAALDVGLEKKKDENAEDEPRQVPVLNEKSGSLTQKWFPNPNGHITNAGVKLNLDVDYGRFNPGGNIILFRDIGYIPALSNQVFEWERYLKRTM